MTWSVCVAGTIDSDDVITPHGRSGVMLGGSAVYFALAAARFAPVLVNGIVGEDWEERARAILARPGIDISGMVVAPEPTSVWLATHHFEDWSTTERFTSRGPNAGWQPQLSQPSRAAEVLFLASMDTSHQTAVAAQSDARLIAADTMVMFTGAESRIGEVVAAADVLFVTRPELAAITGLAIDDWKAAAAGLIGTGRLRAIVVKAGPLGAAVVTAAGVTERPAHPVKVVIDPTGAGDGLAGGFLGACAAEQRDDEEFFLEALDTGLSTAALAISAFGVAGL